MENQSTQSQLDKIPVRRDKEIELKRMEIAAINKYLSNDRQKTEITKSERTLISIADELATAPFQISEKICEERGIDFEHDLYKNPFLKAFLASYLELGIPLGRAGRKEDKAVLSSYFESLHRDAEKPPSMPGYMK